VLDSEKVFNPVSKKAAFKRTTELCFLAIPCQGEETEKKEN